MAWPGAASALRATATMGWGGALGSVRGTLRVLRSRKRTAALTQAQMDLGRVDQEDLESVSGRQGWNRRTVVAEMRLLEMPASRRRAIASRQCARRSISISPPRRLTGTPAGPARVPGRRTTPLNSEHGRISRGKRDSSGAGRTDATFHQERPRRRSHARRGRPRLPASVCVHARVCVFARRGHGMPAGVIACERHWGAPSPITSPWRPRGVAPHMAWWHPLSMPPFRLLTSDRGPRRAGLSSSSQHPPSPPARHPPSVPPSSRATPPHQPPRLAVARAGSP